MIFDLGFMIGEGNLVFLNFDLRYMIGEGGKKSGLTGRTSQTGKTSRTDQGKGKSLVMAIL
jgi:hypothetical protein